MPYLQLYRDSLYTNLFMTIPVAEITCEPSRAPSTLTYDGKTYKYFDWNNSVIVQQVPIISQNPPFLTSRNRVPTSATMYFKNGVIVNVQESTNSGRLEHFKFGNNDLAQSNNSVATESEPAKLFAISFSYQGTKYIGFTGWLRGTQPNYFRVICCVESSFWESALRPAYDYGTGTDEDGGQGTGKIPHTDIPLTATPSKIVPIGGRGLHAYRINAQAYGSLQGYLWGDSSTLAKSLWQKFNNKTHNPVSCIVGCFSLPEDFMPTGSGNTGINLAGLYLSPISGTCVSVGGNIGFVDKTITFGAIEPPFHNFLDYTAITCKIHVPFCGEMAIAPEQIIGSELTLRYRVDQLNGNVVAAVKANGIVIGELSGNCAYNIPLSGGDDGTLQRLGAITSGVTAVVQDNVQGAMVAMQNGMNAGFSAQLINSDLHGSTTACENRVPYLVWTYSGTAYTPDYAQAQGVPCEFSGNLVAFSGGYGEFEIMSNSPALQLVYDIMGATETEKQEIAALLRNGVIV